MVKSHTGMPHDKLSNVEEREAASPAAFSPAAFFKAPAESLDSIFSRFKAFDEVENKRRTRVTQQRNEPGSVQSKESLPLHTS